MASKTVDQPAEPPEYGKFASALSWDLNELEFRTRAALATLHSAEEIDCDDGAGLALSYVLQGIAKRIEELALRTSDSEYDYVIKPRSHLRSAA